MYSAMSYVPQPSIRILESSLSLPQIRYDLVAQASYARNKAANVQYHDPPTSYIIAYQVGRHIQRSVLASLGRYASSPIDL
jgi:hypothetical protein